MTGGGWAWPDHTQAPGGGGVGSGRVGWAGFVWWLSSSRRLGDAVRLLGGPQLFVLLAAEALVVVAFALEELLEVRFAVELALEGREAAQAAGEKRERAREG